MSRLAVLIGINSYLDRPLKGCVRDVEEIEKVLKKETNKIDIRKFTADLENLSTPTDIANGFSSWPTYDNVCFCLNEIALTVQAGDFVYIHFSGHGTTAKRVDQVSNRVTQDFALVLLLAANNTQMRYLGGLKLAHLVGTMVDKGAIVTVVLDCCFSGGVTRKDNSVRFIEYDPRVDAGFLPENAEDGNRRRTENISCQRTASLRPNWLINPEGHTIITACGPNEVARELTIDSNGNKHGALSYFLLRTFRKLSGVEGEQRQIYHHLFARFLERRAKGRVNQTPMIYGNSRLCFFGPSRTRKQTNPIPIVVRQKKNVQLEAGEAHGICVADEFALAPLHRLVNKQINSALQKHR